MSREEEAVLRRLEKAAVPANLIDPFEGPKGFQWLSKRVTDGSYSPLATRDRSLQFEATAKDPSVERIKQIRDFWKKAIDSDPNQAEREKNKKLLELENDWKKVKRGRSDEQVWVEEATGITAAFFEDFWKKNNHGFEQLYDNQLYYVLLMSLGDGKYRDQLEILLKKHGVNLDTGEGKTISTGLVTAVRAIRGEKIHIIEQNYLSAIGHARQVAPFHNQFLHKEVAVITDVSGFDKKDKNQPQLMVKRDGQIVSRFDDKKIKFKVDEKGVIRQIQGGREDNDAFLWVDGEEKQPLGWQGRADCWKQPIVYCDFNSLGGDIAKDRQIKLRPKNKVGPPDLEGVTAIVQEADALMFDWASTQFIIEGGPRKGFLAWMDYANMLGFKDGVKDFKEAAYFAWDVWSLVIQHEPGLRGKFFKTPEGNIVISEEVIKAVQDNIEGSFSGNKKLQRLLKNNQKIVRTAMEVFLGYLPREKYIAGRDPILLDRYSLPLDRRELTGFYNLFLQFSNLFDQRGFFNKPPKNGDFDRLIEESLITIQAASTTLARVLPQDIFNQYGNLVFTSGSLVPLATYFANLYGAEILGVERHQPLKEEIPPPDRHLYTKTLDGGIAEIDFVKKPLRSRLIFEVINEIQEKGRAGLVIMPDIESAYQLNRELDRLFFEEEAIRGRFDNLVEVKSGDVQALNRDRQITLITGQEEHIERGLLNKIVANLKPGDIVITTQIAHRDVDPQPNQELVANGGYEAIVCDPPNERGMWQALQRAVRFNTPGKRRLIISDDEVKKVAEKHLLPKGPASPFDLPDKDKLKKIHEERLASFDRFWEQSVQGDVESQKIIFAQYLDYLRLGESRIAEQLRQMAINDSRLEEWQKLFIEKITNRKAWREETEVLAAFELGLIGKLNSLRNPTLSMMSNEDREVQERLALRHGQIQEQILSYLWTNFLEIIDTRFNLFLMAPYGEWSGGQMIRGDNTAELILAWDNEVKQFIKEYRNHHLFIALAANLSKVELAPRRKRPRGARHKLGEKPNTP